jgi:heme oxygenase (biliverdin-producing, ferredoxin)
VLKPAYNPTLLSRAPNLTSDIAFFLQCQEATWQSHPIHTAFLLSRPQAFIEYIARLQELSDSADPSLLLAHAYVRYLGDLSGGQVIRRRLAKAYNIDVDGGEGVMFYNFRNLEGTRSGTAGDFKKIKGWYRARMNAGTRNEEQCKGETSKSSHWYDLPLNAIPLKLHCSRRPIEPSS